MRWMMLSLAAGALVLSGCASAPTPIVAEENVDFAKVNRIERMARAVGVSVYWVNYPQKSTSVH